MAKRRGFPPVYKIERVAKMSVKRAFFSIFQKLTLFCCAIFFGFSNAFSANLPSGYTELEYIQIQNYSSDKYGYIDSGVYSQPNISVNMRVSFDMNTNAEQSFFGTRDTYPFILNLSYMKIRTIDSDGNWYTGGNALATNTIYDIAMNSITGTISIDGNVAISGIAPIPQERTNYMFVGAAKGHTSQKFEGKIYGCSISVGNTMQRNFIPAKRNSDDVVGMYDMVSGTFFTNAGTGTFTAGPVVIKIATTAYNSARFSPVKTDLNNAVATIREIVTKTINQTAAIASLQADKQTRPADDYTDETNTENCPKFRQCLLIEDNNNIPHWYLIKDPVRDLVKSLRDNKINNAGETTTTAYVANGYDGTNGTTDSRYYKGYVAMRKLADGSTFVQNRQFGASLTGGDNGGQYKTLGDQEWAVTWDGAETGTAGSFLPGVIYGTSRCSKVKPSSTAVGTEGWTTIENSEPTNDAANIASYVNCYCKMTGVGVDGEFTPVRDSSRAPWVFYYTYGSAVVCAANCAYYCATDLRDNAPFRQSLMGWAVE